MRARLWEGGGGKGRGSKGGRARVAVIYVFTMRWGVCSPASDGLIGSALYAQIVCRFDALSLALRGLCCESVCAFLHPWPHNLCLHPRCIRGCTQTCGARRGIPRPSSRPLPRGVQCLRHIHPAPCDGVRTTARRVDCRAMQSRGAPASRSARTASSCADASCPARASTAISQCEGGPLQRHFAHARVCELRTLPVECLRELRRLFLSHLEEVGERGHAQALRVDTIPSVHYPQLACQHPWGGESGRARVVIQSPHGLVRTAASRQLSRLVPFRGLVFVFPCLVF